MQKLADVLACSVKLNDKNVRITSHEGSLLHFILESSDHREEFAIYDEEQKTHFFDFIEQQLKIYQKDEEEIPTNDTSLKKDESDESSGEDDLTEFGLNSGGTFIVKDDEELDKLKEMFGSTTISSDISQNDTVVVHDHIEDDEPQIFRKSAQVFHSKFWRPPTIKMRSTSNEEMPEMVNDQLEDTTLLELKTKLEDNNDEIMKLRRQIKKQMEEISKLKKENQQLKNQLKNQ